MPNGRDERKEILLNILKFLISPVWQLQVWLLFLSILTQGEDYHFHYIPGYTQIFSVSQEIWKVSPGRQSFFISPHWKQML